MLFLITNTSCRVTVQHKALIRHALIVMLPSNILTSKLQNIIQQLPVGGDSLGMIFLLFGYIVFMSLICSRLHEQSWPYETNSIYCGSCYCCIRFLDLNCNFDQESKKILQMLLLKLQTVLHMFSLVCIFPKITLREFLKVLLCLLEGYAILMRNLKGVVHNIRTI